MPAALLLPAPAPAARDLTSSRLARGRLASIGAMGDEQRGNKLPTSRMRAEYVVHGHFFLSPTDQNARPNAFWVPLRKMLEDVGEDAVKTDIQIYQAQAEAAFEQELLDYEEEQAESDHETCGDG